MLGEKVNMKTILNNAITCSTDYNYIKYLDTFIQTYQKTGMNTKLFVRLIDFTNNQKDNIIKKYKDVYFIIDNPNLSSKKTLFKTKEKKEISHVYKIKNIFDMKKILYSPRSFYTCHSRFKTINELLKNNYNVLSLDVDTIFLQNFDHLFDSLKYDILTVTDVNNSDIFCNEGFLLFKNNKINMDYINKIHNYIFKEKNFYNWDADHHALHTFYTDEIQINLLDYKYKDKNHHDDSIMWSGDGYNKYKEKFTSNLDG